MYETMNKCVPVEDKCIPTPSMTVNDCLCEINQHMMRMLEQTRSIGLLLYADELHQIGNEKEPTCLQDLIEDILNRAIIIEDNINIIKGRLGK